jgi:predicted transglutaminase-like cysteine proteinase
VADAIPIPKFSSAIGTGAEVAMPQAPARFFTINGALAKREGGRPQDAAVRLATSTPGDRLSDVIEPAPAAIAQSDEPFGMQAFRAPEGLLWTKWRTLENEMKGEEARLQSCKADPDSCTTEASKFWTLVGQVKAVGGQAKLEKANQLANSAIAYASDMSLHGQLDRWSAPLASLKLGKGDCEDYAILKYRVLTEAGVPAKDLKILLVRDTAVRVDHAVLAARTNDRWFILDNRRSGFYVERDLPHYMPLFALDQNGVKLFAAPYASLPAVNSDEAVLPGLNDDAAVPAVGNTLPLLL